MTIQFHSKTAIPTGDWVWVFGSEGNGQHGKGNARIARVNFRAEYGFSNGRTNAAYAIPVTSTNGKALELSKVEDHIAAFLAYAAEHPKENFFVTRVGSDKEYFSDDQIGPLFVRAPKNCSLPDEWRLYVTQSMSTVNTSSGVQLGAEAGGEAPEYIRCPFCGQMTLEDSIEPPADYCHHEVFP